MLSVANVSFLFSCYDKEDCRVFFKLDSIDTVSSLDRRADLESDTDTGDVVGG